MANLKRKREARGRSEICENIEEMWKRKREKQGEGGGREEEVFRGSKKTVRSLDIEKRMGAGLEEIMRRLIREKLRGVMEEIKEIKGWKEEVKKMREEVKEEMKGGIKEQGERLRKDLEEMRKESVKRDGGRRKRKWRGRLKHWRRG